MLEGGAFKIPADGKDISSSNYRLTHKIDYNVITGSGSAWSQALSAAEDLILDSEQDPLVLAENPVVFDTLYGFCDVIDKTNVNVRECVFDLLVKISALLNKSLAIVLEKDELTNTNRTKYLNAVKMCYYLWSLAIKRLEAEAVDTQKHFKDPSVVAASVTKSGGKKGKKSGGTAAGSEWEWCSALTKGLAPMCDVLELDLGRVWNLSCPEEDFMGLFSRTCYMLLENPNHTKDKFVTRGIFNIIGNLVSKYQHSLGATTSLTHLLLNLGHLAQPLADLISCLITDFDHTHVIFEIIREVGRMDSKEFVRNTEGAKSLYTFLTSVSEKHPKLFCGSLSIIIPHLDGESHIMRNACLVVIGNVLTHLSEETSECAEEENGSESEEDEEVLGSEAEESESDSDADASEYDSEGERKEKQPPRKAQKRAKKTQVAEEKKKDYKEIREQLLDILIERMHDVSSYVRSKVLQIWGTLISAQAVPLSKNLRVLNLCISRLQDKTSAVRKNAVVLLKTFLECNPYSSKIQISILKESLDSESAKLMDMVKGIGMESIKDDMSVDESMEEDVDEELDHSEDKTKAPKDASVNSILEQLRNLKISSTSTVEMEEVNKQRIVVQYCYDAYEFAKAIDHAMPTLGQLLGSTSATDVKETIAFFIRASEFGVEGAEKVGIRKMLGLVWSADEGMKDIVINAYFSLYLCPETLNKQANPKMYVISAVKNLIALTFEASLGELTSLEVMIKEMTQSGQIGNDIIKALWDVFSHMESNIDSRHRRGALIILSMVALSKPEVIQSKLKALISIAFGAFGSEEEDNNGDECRTAKDWIIVKYALLSMQRLVIDKSSTLKSKKLNASFKRLENDHFIFTSICKVILDQCDEHMWYTASEQVINTIYCLAEHPDAICSQIIKDLSANVFGYSFSTSNGSLSVEELPKTGRSSSLSHLIFIVGHVALKQLVHLEVIQSAMKKSRAASEKKPKEKKSKDNKDDEDESIEDQLGLNTAAADDADAEFINDLCQNELVNGSNLLGVFGPLIVYIVVHWKEFEGDHLRECSVLSLVKFMCVSSTFCERNLRLLFTILHNAPENVIRTDIIIALGDLCFRFPNLLEPWTPHLYSRLQDSDRRVRKNTLMVLTHLILNDMIKVKGQISEMCKCLEDEDARIQDLARLFFHELNKKGNTIYNILPDILSHLSCSVEVAAVKQDFSSDTKPSTAISKEKFDSIMKHLFSFVGKNERQVETLVEKLCHRFRGTKDVNQWRDLSSCLTYLNYGDKAIKKLQENFGCFADKVVTEEIHNHFKTILKSCRMLIKEETKAIVDDFEKSLEEAYSSLVEDQKTTMKAADAGKKGGKTIKTEKVETVWVHTSGKNSPVQEDESEEDKENESSELNLSMGDENVARKASTRQPRRRNVVVDDDDSDDDFEL